MNGNEQSIREAQALNQALAETQQRMAALGNQSLMVQNSVSQALGQVRSQLRQLGNTMVPVANIGLNLFSKLLSVIQPVVRELASFLTTLFGVKWAGKASDVGRTATALGKTSSALKKTAKATRSVASATKSVARAQRELMSFDEINKLSPKTPSGASGGKAGKGGTGTGGYGGGIGRGGRSVLDGMKVAVSAWALKVRKILEDIWTPFQKAWKKKGEYVLKSARTALDKILKAAKTFGSTWLTIWKDEAGTRMIGTILNIVAKVCDTAGNLADRFREAWESCGNGESIVNSVFGVLQDALECVEDLVDATKSWSETLDLTDAVGSVSNLLESFRNLADVVEGALADAYEKVLLPLASWTIESAVPAVLDSMASAFDLMSGVLSVLQPAAEAVWENFLQPLAQWTGGMAVSALEDLSDVMSQLGSLLSDIGDILASSDNWTDKLLSIGELLVSSLKSGINSAFSNIESWVKNNVIDKITDGMSGLGSSVKSLFKSAYSSALDAWDNIGSSFKSVAGKAVSGIKNGLGSGPKSLFSSAYSAACGAWSNISSKFKSIAGNAVGAIKSGLSVSKLKSALTYPFRTALNAVISLANRVVSKINRAMRFSWKAVRVAGVTLVKAGSVSLAHLPHLSYLAQGGVLTRATPMVAGEAGAEAVVPLERNLGWLDKMAGMLAGKLNGGGQPMVVQCVLDGRVIASTTVDYINRRARATGIHPLAGYI